MIKKQVETRKFRMHPDLLYSVIKAQAGTHEKALLEAVMNAVDAGASQCEITLDEKGYVITDNGKGFANRQEIENFFETFGTPHTEGDATYGKFRMGRGQLFAFSRTVWHSNEFLMDVCIKTKGLDYIFEEGQKPFKGCKITGTWHDKLKQAEIMSLNRELKLLVKYMQIPIIFNGENISSNAETQKWDKQTPEAYIKTSESSGTLSVYNLGALVCHYPASKFGIGGIVVAKQQLTVNFARNDVLVNQCKVWKKISKTLNELMGIETKKKNILTESERIAMANNIIGGTMFMSECMNKGILTDITSKRPTLKALLKIKRLSFSSGNYQTKIVEEKIHTQELAFVLEHGMLARFGVKTAKEFVTKINELIALNNKHHAALGWSKAQSQGISNIYEKFNPTIVPMEQLLKSFNSTFEFKTEKTISKKEKCILNVMNEISSSVSQLVDSHLHRKEKNSNCYAMAHQTVRKISIGISEVADAWTDGSTYIAFSDKVVTRATAHEIVYVMIHEYCHNEATNETHSHGIEFFEMFHDIICYQPYAVSNIITRFNTLLLGQYTRANIKSKGLEVSVIENDKVLEHMEG